MSIEVTKTLEKYEWQGLPEEVPTPSSAPLSGEYPYCVIIKATRSDGSVEYFVYGATGKYLHTIEGGIDCIFYRENGDAMDVFIIQYRNGSWFGHGAVDAGTMHAIALNSTDSNGNVFELLWSNHDIVTVESTTNIETGETYFTKSGDVIYGPVTETFTLPEIPTEWLSTYPYAAIAEIELDATIYGMYQYMVIAILSPIGMQYASPELTGEGIGYSISAPCNVSYTYNAETDSWEGFTESTVETMGYEGSLTIMEGYTVSGQTLWSNHNIYVLEADAEGNLVLTDEVYFSGFGVVEPPEKMAVDRTFMVTAAANTRRFAGVTDKLTTAAMESSLNGLDFSLQAKTVSPATESQTITPDSNYYGLSSVTVNGVTSAPNGRTWTQSNITSGHFYVTHNANGIWVAGSSAGLYYSTDGKTWTQSNVTSVSIQHLHYANGIWVAGSNGNNGLYYSTDGKTWTQSNITSVPIGCVHNANGIWVAGSNGSNTGLYYSTDGKTWTQSNITSYHFKDVYNADGIWVACNSNNLGIYYSTDGKTWTRSNITSGIFYGVYNANGIWVACAGTTNTGLYYSTDGKTWTQSNITSGCFNGVYNANGIWVAYGSSGSNTGLYYSTDGKTWTQSNITSEYFYDVYYANGIWVACGYCTYFSTNGKTWSKSNITIYTFYDAHNANGIWVACCSGNNGLYYSVTWEES